MQGNHSLITYNVGGTVTRLFRLSNAIRHSAKVKREFKAAGANSASTGLAISSIAKGIVQQAMAGIYFKYVNALKSGQRPRTDETSESVIGCNAKLRSVWLAISSAAAAWTHLDKRGKPRGLARLHNACVQECVKT